MLKNKLLQDSLKTHFLKKDLDDVQKESLAKSLNNSRYSRLHYNLSINQLLDECLRGHQSSHIEDLSTSTNPPPNATVDFDKAFLILESTINRLDLQDPKKKTPDWDGIDSLVENLPKSPRSATTTSENHYLSAQKLTTDEEAYIVEQERIRKKQYEDARKKIARSIVQKPQDLLGSVNALKQQQKASRDENSEYEAKRAQNLPRKERLEQIVATLTGIQKRVEEAKQRLEFSVKDLEAKAGSDKQLALELSETLSSVANLLSEKQINLKRLDNSSLNETERTLKEKESKLLKKVELEIEKNERERAMQLLRERQAHEARLAKESAFLRETDRLVASLEAVSNGIVMILNELRVKSDMIMGLQTKVELLADVNELTKTVETTLERVNILKKELKSSSENAKLLTDSEMDRTLGQFSPTVIEFSNQQREFLDKIKSIEAKIKLQLEEQQLKELEKKKAEAEKQRRELEEQAERQAAAEKQRAIDQEIQKQQEMAEKEAREKQQNASRAQNSAKLIDETNKKGISAQSLQEYEKNQKMLADLGSQVDKALSSSKLYKFDLQKAINVPLNTLLDDKTSDESRRNFSEKIKTLCRLLAGQTCTITSTLTVNASQHPQAIPFCLVYLSSKLVEKAEETTASRPDTAFQYAQLVLEVLKNVKDFELILLAKFHEKCPYTVPYYKPRAANQSDEDFFKTLGYKIIDGKVEDDVHFYKRVSGIMHLFFTLMVCSSTQQAEYFNLKHAWRWLVELLNMNPRANITAEILAIFFKCCGYSMQQTYGRQFDKLVGLCSNDLVGLIRSIPSEKQSGACVGRLEAVLAEYKKSGRFPVWKKSV